jgi:hypothetical protein
MALLIPRFSKKNKNKVSINAFFKITYPNDLCYNALFLKKKKVLMEPFNGSIN